MTITSEEGAKTITFTVADTYNFTGVFLNGQKQTVADPVEDVYSFEKPTADGILVILGTPKREAVAASDKWYNNPKTIASLPMFSYSDGYNAMNWAPDVYGEYLDFTFGTGNPSSSHGCGLTTVSSMESGAPVANWTFDIGARGSAACAARNVVLIGIGTGESLKAMPINETPTEENSVVLTIPNNYVPDAMAFSSDNKYLYANDYGNNSGDSRNYVYKYVLPNDLLAEGAALELDSTWPIGSRVRSMQIGRVNGKDYLYVNCSDAKKYYLIDTTKTGAEAVTEVVSSGVNQNDKIAVAGVTGGTPHLYYLVNNGQGDFGSRIEVYNLDVNTGWIDANQPDVIKTWKVNDLGDMISTSTAGMTCLYVTDDEKSLLISLEDKATGKHGVVAVQNNADVIRHKVIFIDGTYVVTNEVADGQKTVSPSPRTAFGYTFDGWFNENGAKFSDKDPVTEDATYTSRYHANTHKVIIELDGAAVPAGWTKSSANAYTNFTVEVADFDLPALAKTHYAFDGYVMKTNSNPAKYSAATNANVTIECSKLNWDVTYKACFTEDAKYQIVFVNGEAATTNFVYAGDTCTAPAAPTPAEGKKFDGWKCDETVVAAGETFTPTADMTFEAQFSDAGIGPGEEKPVEGDDEDTARENAQKLPIVLSQEQVDAGMTTDYLVNNVKSNGAGGFVAFVDVNKAAIEAATGMPLGLDTSAEEPLKVDAENVTAKVKTVVGVWYGMDEAGELTGAEFDPVVSTYVIGNGETKTFTIPKKANATKAFYKVGVRVIPPTAK